jgi:deazaflavin-dependent oxidoreductase (nitroreductase family)
MWFMNKIANPFVRSILRSPLHRMLSTAVLLISYQGRKSGKTHTLPVNYVQDGNTIYIVPGMPEQKTWWRNLRGGAQVTLTLKGKIVPGLAQLLQGGSEAAEILDLYLKRFPASARLHAVRLLGDGTYDPDDLRREAESLVFVQVKLPEQTAPSAK